MYKSYLCNIKLIKQSLQYSKSAYYKYLRPAGYSYHKLCLLNKGTACIDNIN